MSSCIKCQNVLLQQYSMQTSISLFQEHCRVWKAHFY